MGTVREGMHPSRHEDPIGALEAMVARGDVDLLTCDVFETLVWRPVVRPSDLFVALAGRLHGDGLLPAEVTCDDFCEGRRHAERRARAHSRRATGELECSLEDIWALMPARWHRRSPSGSRIDVEDWRRTGLDAELRIEGDVLRVHTRVAHLLETARSNGILTALVSDTYFSEAQLRALLDRAGVRLDTVDLVAASSEWGRGKYRGLIGDVVSRLGASPARTAHLGDNPVADLRAAEELGATAVSSVLPRADMAAPAVVDAMSTCSAVHGTDGAITGVVNELLLDPQVCGRPDAELGAAVGAPLLFGLAGWASRTAEALGAETIHCLLREGQVIGDAIGRVRPDGPSTRTVHASRWTTMRAAVIEGTPDELIRALARGAEFSPAHVVEAFAVDRRLVTTVIGDRVHDDAHRVDAIELISSHDELRQAIVAASAELRSRLLRYLDEALVPGRPLVLCDIGWGGTIQEGLEAILRHEGRLAEDDEVIGLYLSLSAPGRARVGGGSRMLSYLPTDALHRHEQQVLQRTPEIPEQLFTPDVGTFLDIDEHGAPVTAEHDSTWTESRARAQTAMLRGVDALVASGASSAHSATGAGPVWDTVEMRSALLRGLATTLESPTRQLADALTGWLHDDVAGGAVVPLARTEELTFLPFLSAADVDRISMRDVFWLPGAAASANPPLAAQLTAGARGVDLEALCPESEAGRATIAVYPPDDDTAIAVDHPIPRVDARGWSLLRLRTNAPAVRDVRLDFGDVDHLVELDHLTIRFTRRSDDDDVDSTWHLERVDDRRLRWSGGRAIGRRRAAVRAGGHVIIPVSDTPEADAHLVDIECAFRVTALGAADRDLLPSPARVAATALVRRARGAATRGARALVASRAAPGAVAPAGVTGPSFSIVLPIYESPLPYLEQQLRAIRGQSYPSWECIVVDDGSPSSEARELVRRLTADEPRFVLHVRPENGGISAATNDALDRAANEWVVFVDHDDAVHRDALARLAEHIVANPCDDVVYTDERMVDGDGREITPYQKPDYSPERLLGHNYLCHIVTMRRDLVERVGRLDPACEPSADRDFNLRATEIARGVGHVPEVLYDWRAIPGSVATAIDEKPEVGRSVVAGAERALARRGETATIVPTSDPASVRVARPAVGAVVDEIPIAPTTTSAEIHQRLCASAADVVVLAPVDAVASDGTDQLVAACCDGYPVVGPHLVTDDGRFVSGGQAHRPTIHHPFRGMEADNPGPWGAFLVAREVSSVSPLGAALDRERLLDIGGFDLSALLRTAGLDDAAIGTVDTIVSDEPSPTLVLAVACTVLRTTGRPALWSPLATVMIPAALLDDRAHDERLTRQVRRLAAAWPAITDEHYSPWGTQSPAADRAGAVS